MGTCPTNARPPVLDVPKGAQRRPRRQSPRLVSDLADELAAQISLCGLPEPVREYRFSRRRWRFDLCWPDRMLALEVEGLTRAGGRHQLVEGYEEDCVKYSAAVLAGWRLLRVTGRMVRDGRALALVEMALKEVSGG